MNKEYFSHDYNARTDPKLSKLLMKLGTEGLGIYWCIIEILYEQGGYISLDHLETIAFELHQQCDRIASVLKDFDLFKFNEDKLYSESVLRRLEIRTDKSNKARAAANIKWGNDASALHPQCNRNAIKGNKRILNKKKRKIFIAPTLLEVITYFTDNGYTKEAAEKAYNHYQLADWHDSYGNQVLNWKQKVHTVWFKPENKIQQVIPTFGIPGQDISKIR